MLKHIVIWNLKDPAQGPELKRRLEALVGVVPSIRAFEVGMNIVPSETAGDIVLVSTFDDPAGLKAYAEHPEHLKVVDFVKQVVSHRRAADYLA